jgi:hypothetical protein
MIAEYIFRDTKMKSVHFGHINKRNTMAVLFQIVLLQSWSSNLIWSTFLPYFYITGLVMGMASLWWEKWDRVLFTLTRVLCGNGSANTSCVVIQVYPGGMREALHLTQQAETTWEGP